MLKIPEVLLENGTNCPPVFLFLGGIHGVGKSYLSKSVFGPCGYHCVTASELIEKYGAITNKDKCVANVELNQVVLLEAVKQVRRKHNSLLLDGHFSLVNKQNLIEPIDKFVFLALQPTVLLLLKEKSNVVADRLLNRDGKKWDVSFIEHYQEIEHQHALHISKELDIPLHIIGQGQSS